MWLLAVLESLPFGDILWSTMCKYVTCWSYSLIITFLMQHGYVPKAVLNSKPNPVLHVDPVLHGDLVLVVTVGLGRPYI